MRVKMMSEPMYSWVFSHPPCASCGTSIEPKEVEDFNSIPVRELIGKSCVEETPKNFRIGDCDFGKSCVFHKGCWELLIKHFISGVVPIDKLAEVVKEAPSPRYRVYDLILKPGIPSFRCIGYRAEAKTFPKAANMKCENPLKEEKTQENDCFCLLPLEIRVEIAYLLPTQEYLSLRLASKAMVHIFGYQEFWKTRFLIHRERGFLNYLLEQGCGDWRSMYRYTGRLERLPRTLHFRRLQWLHNEWIKDRCMMVGAPLTISAEIDDRCGALLWDKAAGKVQCDRLCKHIFPFPIPNGICERCHRTHILLPPQMITISGDLVEISVSVLAEDEHSFITGLKLVYGESTPSVCLGYQIPEKQIKINLRGRRLAGLEVFAGEGGIQAIRPIVDEKYGIRHSIIGKPKTACRPVLLAPNGEIKAFAGIFDHCRMVRLEVGSLRPKHHNV